MFGLGDFLSYFDSVILYYLIFITAFCFFLAADRFKNGTVAKLCTLSGVLVLAFFAGARDLTVGIDTYTTVQAFFIPFDSVSSLDIVDYTGYTEEPIYRYLSFILHRVTHEPWIFLFIAQLLTAGPVAIGLQRYHKKIFLSVGMLVYMLLFYQVSLNIIRQSIATAFLFWAFVECLNGFNLRGVFLSVVSILFHKSGIIGAVLIFLILILAKVKRENSRKLIISISILISFIALLYWQPIVSWFVSHDLLPDKLIRYVAFFSSGDFGGQAHKFVNKGVGAIGIVRMSISFLGIFLSVYTLNVKIKQYDYDTLAMKYAVVLSLGLYAAIFFSLNTIMGWRISMYLEYMQILLYSRIYAIVSDNTELYKNGAIHIKNPASLNFILYPFIYNIIVIMIVYSSGTLPYLFG